MPEGISTENLMSNIMETLNDSISHQKSGYPTSFYGEDKSSSVTSQFSKLFGRQKPVHHILGGGKSADVLLWRNKKISAGVLCGATVIWVLFEWLNYHFLSLICFGLVFGLIAQFVLSNASGMLNRSRSEVPRLVLPEELFVNIAKTAGLQVNHTLAFLQDVACQGSLKQFIIVLLVPTLCQCCMRGMKMKWMGLFAVPLNSLRKVTKSWTPPSYANFQLVNSEQRNENE